VQQARIGCLQTALCVIVLVAAATASAQTPFVVVPAGQDSLLLEAADAARAGDLALAEDKYRAALQIGELNIAYLGLARVVQRQGQCRTAEQLWKQVAAAPAAEPPYPGPDELQSVVQKYRTDDARLCPGWLLVECVRGKPTVKVAGNPAACGDRLELPPGTYEVTAARGGELSSVTVEVIGLQQGVATLDVPDPIAPAVRAPAAAPVRKSAPALAPTEDPQLAWWLVGTGVVLATSTGGLAWAQASNDAAISRRARGGIPDAGAAREARDLEERGERLRWAQWGTGSLAVLSLAAGVALLTFDEEEPTAIALGPWPGGAGVWLSGAFP
jgi:hypothetical protein